MGSVFSRPAAKYAVGIAAFLLVLRYIRKRLANLPPMPMALPIIGNFYLAVPDPKTNTPVGNACGASERDARGCGGACVLSCIRARSSSPPSAACLPQPMHKIMFDLSRKHGGVMGFQFGNKYTVRSPP